MWFVKQVVIPVFGHTLRLSDGNCANVKDAMEQDHILPDFSNRFIPTLADYLGCVADDAGDKELIGEFDRQNAAFYVDHPQVRELMLSPLGLTGQIKSLLVTHNSWFVQRILPKVFPTVRVEIRDFNIAPAVLFHRMDFQDWMNNGRGVPPSFAKVNEHRKRKTETTKEPAVSRAPSPGDMVFDGSRGRPSFLVD